MLVLGLSATLLGHHSMDMTLRYAKIASRTVADEYFAVTEKVEALYDNPPALPASAAGPEMAGLHREMRHDLVGELSTRSDDFRRRWAPTTSAPTAPASNTSITTSSATSPSPTKASTCAPNPTSP